MRHLLPALAISLAGVTGATPASAGMRAEGADSLVTLRSVQQEVRRYRNHVLLGRIPTGYRLTMEERVAIVHELRPSLISRLDRAGEELPGDDWIVGHRVGLRMEGGLLQEALAVAQTCQGSAWWCAALEGWARHALLDFGGAEGAFERALGGMPDHVRCHWLEDLSVLFRGQAAAVYRSADCETKARLEARLWWLADPLHSLPWNDRRTEQYARQVAMHLHHEYLELAFTSCTVEHHRSVLLHGWPPWWHSVHSNLPPPGWVRGDHFVPPPEVILEPLSAHPTAWPLGTWSLSRDLYDPPYGPFHPLDEQTVFLVRGDSLLVLVATDTAGHGLGGARELEATVALTRNEGESPRFLQDGPEGRPLRFGGMVARDAWLVSVELRSTTRGVGRARFGHQAPSGAGIGLSDLLLYEWSDGLDETLDAVLPRMLPHRRVQEKGGVGLYWEVYGLRAGQPVEFELTARRRDRGLLRRLGEAVRVVSPHAQVSIRWSAAPDDGEGPFARTLHLDLGRLDPGLYDMELSARTAEGGHALARREVVVEGSAASPPRPPRGRGSLVDRYPPVYARSGRGPWCGPGRGPWRGGRTPA